MRIISLVDLVCPAHVVRQMPPEGRCKRATPSRATFCVAGDAVFSGTSTTLRGYVSVHEDRESHSLLECRRVVFSIESKNSKVAPRACSEAALVASRVLATKP